MRTVRQYMTPAPTEVSPDAPLGETRELMRESGIHHLPVILGKQLVGLVTEIDLVTFEEMSELYRHRLRVEDIMIPVPPVVPAETPLVGAAREMLSCRCSAVVVVQDDEVVGIFTLTDALRALLEILEAGEPLAGPLPEATRPEEQRLDDGKLPRAIMSAGGGGAPPSGGPIQHVGGRGGG
jgi:acetoin utilization protein AcuB